VTAAAEECRRFLPSAHDLRWPDVRLTVHNCAWFVCELLQKLTASRLRAAPVTAAFNDSVHLLVGLACQSASDVSRESFALIAASRSRPADII